MGIHPSHYEFNTQNLLKNPLNLKNPLAAPPSKDQKILCQITFPDNSIISIQISIQEKIEAIIEIIKNKAKCSLIKNSHRIISLKSLENNIILDYILANNLQLSRIKIPTQKTLNLAPILQPDLPNPLNLTLINLSDFKFIKIIGKGATSSVFLGKKI